MDLTRYTTTTFIKPIVSELVGTIKSTVPFFSGHAGRDRTTHPFWVIVTKEISDHFKSWRFIIMIMLVAITCMGSLYTGVTNIREAGNANDTDFFFLKLFTATDDTLPSFIVFISFLGPLLGISLGFDAINSEVNRGTLTRIIAQPVSRDYILNAKFAAAIIVISVMLFALAFLVMGAGLVRIGIPPTPEEFWRVVSFILVTVAYVAFWLNLAILLSVRFRQPATSALCSIAIWIFLTVFYSLIVNVIAKVSAPPDFASAQQILSYQQFIINLMRVIPSQLYSDATTTLLVPSIRSLSPLTMEQIHGTIPGPLPLGQSLLIVWPQITGLLAATIICFGLSYISFMRKEFRSR